MRLFPRTNANGSITWWVSWSEGRRTKTRSTRVSDEANAATIAAEWERERIDPVYAATKKATFGTEASGFLASCEGAVKRGKMAEGTLSMYRQKAGTLVRILETEVGHPLRLLDVGPNTFASYLDTRRAQFLEDRGKEITESNLYKEWVTFKQILTRAWRGRRFLTDPATLKPEHFGPEYKPRETALTWEQVNKLLEAVSPVRRSHVAFVLATGARRREAERYQLGDLDTKTWRVRLRGTKTAASARVIPVPSLMRRLLEAHPPKAPFLGWQNARRDMAAACASAEIPAVTWNDLRRTFASLLVQAGVPPHIVAKLLGHTTTTMTDRVYGRQTADSLEVLLDDALREAPVKHSPPNSTPPTDKE